LISHKHRFIYIHPAKTGGTSIEKALEPYCEERIVFDLKLSHYFAMYGERNTKHHSFAMYQSFLIDHDLSEYKVIYSIRNPWDRVLSMWAYQNSLKDVGLKYQDDVEGFRRFVKNFYKDFVFGNVNILDLIQGCDLSSVIRFEYLQEDFNKVCTWIGLPEIELPHLVESRHGDRREYYNDETRRIVGALFSRDIKYFIFEF